MCIRGDEESQADGLDAAYFSSLTFFAAVRKHNKSDLNHVSRFEVHLVEVPSIPAYTRTTDSYKLSHYRPTLPAAYTSPSPLFILHWSAEPHPSHFINFQHLIHNDQKS
jgi:hypothetical protein